MGREAGWYEDLFYQDQERYWDGKVWTMHARPVGSGDPTPPPGFVAPTLETSAALTRPTSPVPSTRWGPSPGDPNSAHALFTPGSGAPPKRRWTTVATAVAAAALVVGGPVGVGTLVVFGEHGTAAASEAVSQAVTQSLNEKSADVTLDMSLSMGDMNEHMTGSGAFDFGDKTGSFTMNIPEGDVPGQATTQLDEQLIMDGSTVYVGLPSMINQVMPGKSWISLDLSQYTSGAGGLSSGAGSFEDPTAFLRQLQSNGATVTSLGPTTFGGSAVTEYSVTIPTSTLEPDLWGLGGTGSGASGDTGLSSSLQKMTAGMLPPTVTEKVYITDANLLKGVDVPLSLSLLGKSMSEDMTVTYSNYGVPVTVTPPPADQVATLQQFESAAGASDGSGGLGNSGNTANTGNTGNSGQCGCAAVPPVSS